ncbi:MAG: CaiB/BaiF CoA-transferase family protein [Rhodospirillales bacterium]
MPGPLEGVTIVDLTQMIAGPLATMILADQGATVIKVENPKGGDHTREVSQARGDLSASFLNNNRNKRSLALDLKSPDGLAALKRLIATADVFVQNFRPGVMDRMGLGETSLREINPALIYVSISGFGDQGPYAHKPVYDPLVQALSGLTTVQAGSDQERPRLVRTILPDKLTGITASQAITAALFARERQGGRKAEGQHVRLSMLDAVIAFLWASDMSSQTFVGAERPQQEAQSFIDLVYETTDGYISVAVQSNREWAALTEALERPAWRDDPRFQTPTDRQRNINDRLSLTQEVLATGSSAHWLERLEAHDVPCAPVLRRRDLESHPQIQASDIIQVFQHDLAGDLRQARPAALFSKTPPTYRHGGRPLGADGAEILADLGYDEGEIDRILAREPAGAEA